MKTIEVKVYEFDELSDSSKQVALEKFAEINVDFDWYEPIYEGCMEEAVEAGFQIDKIYFSGFWSQGDGAMFNYTGLDRKLLEQAVNTLTIPDWKKNILRNGYLSGSGKQTGHYYHSRSCSHHIWVETDNGMQLYPNIENLFCRYEEQIEDYIINLYENLCNSLYKNLEAYYNELTSEDYVISTIKENEYVFTEDGKVFV